MLSEPYNNAETFNRSEKENQANLQELVVGFVYWNQNYASMVDCICFLVSQVL
jgi:hypothetical protein